MVRDGSSPVMTVLNGLCAWLDYLCFLTLEGKENKDKQVWTIYCARRFVSFRRSLTREGIDLICQLSIGRVHGYWWCSGLFLKFACKIPCTRVRINCMYSGHLVDLKDRRSARRLWEKNRRSSASDFLRRVLFVGSEYRWIEALQSPTVWTLAVCGGRGGQNEFILPFLWFYIDSARQSIAPAFQRTRQSYKCCYRTLSSTKRHNPNNDINSIILANSVSSWITRIVIDRNRYITIIAPRPGIS